MSVSRGTAPLREMAPSASTIVRIVAPVDSTGVVCKRAEQPLQVSRLEAAHRLPVSYTHLTLPTKA